MKNMQGQMNTSKEGLKNTRPFSFKNITLSRKGLTNESNTIYNSELTKENFFY